MIFVGMIILLEILIIISNFSMKNYDIEMWKYSNKLKIKSEFPVLGHEHKISKSARLQSVDISLNNLGLRHDEDLSWKHRFDRRILFLGSSITLGWGVDYEKIFTTRISNMFHELGRDAQVINAGIGNYSTERYVNLFFLKLKKLNPTDIVVNYFINDIEIIQTPKENILLKYSQLAVTVYNIYMRYFQSKGIDNLVDYYSELYKKENNSFIKMKNSLQSLSEYSRNNNIKLYITLMPDTYDLKNYKFKFVSKIIKELSDEFKYSFIDLYPILSNKDRNEVWVMKNDPHPNAHTHNLIAKEIFKKIDISTLN